MSAFFVYGFIISSNRILYESQSIFLVTWFDGGVGQPVFVILFVSRGYSLSPLLSTTLRGSVALKSGC